MEKEGIPISLTERKISDIKRDSINVKSVKGSRLSGTVTENKNIFDRLVEFFVNHYNLVIDDLTESTAARELGADIEDITEKTVQGVLNKHDADIKGRYTKAEADSLLGESTNDLVKSFDLDLSTGIITVVKKDGTIQTWDTALEKIPACFAFVEEAGSYYLQVTNEDGTTSRTDVTELMNHYAFDNSGEVAFTVTGEGPEKRVTAAIRANSIGIDKLSISAVAQLEEYRNSTAQSAAAATASKTAATSSEAVATAAAETAAASEISATSAAETAVTEAANAKTEAARAKEEANRAKSEADRASEIAGGDFVTNGELQAFDDFIHIPLAVCETAGDVRIKEIILSDYTAEKYPVFAVKFANENTCSSSIQLKVNDGPQKPVTTGQSTRSGVSPELYPLGAGATLLLTETSYSSYAIVNSIPMADFEHFGQVIVADNPTGEYGYLGTAASPRYVKTALDDFNDFTHIPFVVCKTAGDQPIKEVMIPGYTPERCPIIAIQFNSANTIATPTLLINGEHEMALRSGNNVNYGFGGADYHLFDHHVYLFGLLDGFDVYKLLNANDTATTSRAGIVQLTGSLSSQSSLLALTAGAGKALNDRITTALLPYSTDTTYSINTLVVQDGAIYKSIQDNNVGHAVTEAEWWKQYGGMEPEPDPDQIINYTMLYNQGDECGEVTGGWAATTSASGSVVTKAQNRVTTHASGNNGDASVSTNPIDLTDYVSCVAVLSNLRIVNTKPTCRITIGPPLNPSASLGYERPTEYVSTTITAENPYTADLSAISGSFACTFSVRNGGAYSDSAAECAMYHFSLLKPDDPARLLSAAGITTAYTTPETFAANASARTAILNNSKAVKIMTLTCTGDLMYAILNNADWITAIKANDEAYRIIMANPHWSKFAGIIPAAKELLGYTMLYDHGDECEAVTGGWTEAKQSNGVPVLLRELSSMVITNNSSTNVDYFYAGAGTTKQIDTTLYAAMHVVIDEDDTVCSARFTTTLINIATFYNTFPIDSSKVSGEISAYGKYHICVIPNPKKTATLKSAALLKPDPFQPWLTAAGITKSYASLDAVLSDEATLAILMSNREAINYLLSCTGTLMAAVCQSETVSSALVNSPVAYDAAFENVHWRKFLLMCPVSLAAMDSLAKKVPVMTSNTAPTGEAFANSEYAGNYTYEAYKAFDKITTTGAASNGGDSCWSGQIGSAYVGYDFKTPVCVYKAVYSPRHYAAGNSQNLSKYHYEYSDDKALWFRANADVIVESKTDANDKVSMLQASGEHRYWRINCVANFGHETLMSVNELQFYGKEVL